MNILLPPPLSEPPEQQSFIQDFKLLLKNQMSVTWNKLRHRPLGSLIGMIAIFLSLLAILISLGALAYGALESMPPMIAQGFLSFLFMAGLVGQIFFGITAAFASLYMSEDLELLFMAPVSLKVVFLIKSLAVLGSNLLVAFIFIFLPGVFYGLLFQAGALFYILVLLVTVGLWIIGTGIAELINLLVMRVVPPHRTKEAIGFIGGIAGLLIALVFQIPSFLLNQQGDANLGNWLVGKENVLYIMNFFPWGWGSVALKEGITGNFFIGLLWSILLLVLGAVIFSFSFILVKRGFQRGFISLSQGEGNGRRKRQKSVAESVKGNQQLAISNLYNQKIDHLSSSWIGMWAVAKKDLLSMKRDVREWFGYLIPLIIMAFFVVQYIFTGADANRVSLVTVLIMYTIMFSGNMALQSFGREGEADWLLNSVPLAGWPVVWGKLVAVILPTLILMQALLVGTAIAIDVSTSLIIALVIAAILLSLGSSSIGLFYSINNSRYNPDNPQKRVAPSASLIMYLVNLLFILVLSLGISYLFPPEEIISVIKTLPPVTYEGGFLSGISYFLYLISRPLLWPTLSRIVLGIIITIGTWSVVFFSFMSATVRKSRKGFRVEIVKGSKRKGSRKSLIRKR